MKIFLSSRGLFALGFLILVVTNILVFTGVASNRSGEPVSQITLSERELRLPYKIHKENSGLALRLNWRALGEEDEYSMYSGSRSPVWLDAEKLKALGFTIKNYGNAAANRKYYKQAIPKEVLLVLEKGGEFYSEAVRRAKVAFEREEGVYKLRPDDKKISDSFKRAEERLEGERKRQTRLFVIDAGLDLKQLREKYGDQSRFIITKGLLVPRYDNSKVEQKVYGYISRLSVSSIHVPRKYRRVFDSILAGGTSGNKDFETPRFEVELAYGSRLEPWLVSVKATR